MPTTTAAPAAPIFLALVPASGYWIGVANHACADPEYIYEPAFIQEALTPDFCGGVETRLIGDPLCDACQAADDDLPF